MVTFSTQKIQRPNRFLAVIGLLVGISIFANRCDVLVICIILHEPFPTSALVSKWCESYESRWVKQFSSCFFFLLFLSQNYKAEAWVKRCMLLPVWIRRLRRRAEADMGWLTHALIVKKHLLVDATMKNREQHWTNTDKWGQMRQCPQEKACSKEWQGLITDIASFGLVLLDVARLFKPLKSKDFSSLGPRRCWSTRNSDGGLQRVRQEWKFPVLTSYCPQDSAGSSIETDPAMPDLVPVTPRPIAKVPKAQGRQWGRFRSFSVSCFGLITWTWGLLLNFQLEIIGWLRLPQVATFLVKSFPDRGR